MLAPRRLFLFAFLLLVAGRAPADTHYVDVNCTNSVYPYTNWSIAATVIQDAIDAASSNDTVLVTNGVYGAIAATNALLVQGLSGVDGTVIDGGGTNRCVWLSSGASLRGFCVTNGHAPGHGGGVLCASTNEIIVDCVLTANVADDYGGGAYRGTLHNCILAGNSAYHGGGSCESTLYNCVLAENSASRSSGGARGGRLFNCTVTGNSDTKHAGGCWSCLLVNCIIYYNVSTTDADNVYNCTLSHCCTIPAQGEACITSPPLFVEPGNADYHLQVVSPCIDTGAGYDGIEGLCDIDGNPRVINAAADIGAYEKPFIARISAFLQGSYHTNTGAMVCALGTNLIPRAAPYLSDDCLARTVPSNGVDWLLVQLIAPQFSNPSVEYARSSFVLQDGTVIREDGSPELPMEVSPHQTNYLVLKHRNHLSVMTAVPLVFTNTLITYDFTTGPDKYYGGTNACVELEAGVWGMIAGDADGDGKITPVDATIRQMQQGKTGYKCGDFDLSGEVDGE